jgi:hypothetical protein
MLKYGRDACCVVVLSCWCGKMPQGADMAQAGPGWHKSSWFRLMLSMKLRLIVLLLVVAPLRLDAQPINHSAFDTVLRAYVHPNGVDYRGVQANRAQLDRYVAQLGTFSGATFDRWTRNEQIAFLINAYNAIVLQQVIDDYPIQRSTRPAALVRPANSVWQIDGFFSELKHRLLGRDLTLDEIEHKWLRAKLKEPRIHFALVCAARSCPPLRAEAYRADQLDAQLDDQARQFLNDRERNRFGEEKAELSEIFKWFGEDFGGEKGLRAYLGKYLNAELSARMQNSGYAIGYIDYDWTLNDTAR